MRNLFDIIKELFTSIFIKKKKHDGDQEFLFSLIMGNFDRTDSDFIKKENKRAVEKKSRVFFIFGLIFK